MKRLLITAALVLPLFLTACDAPPSPPTPPPPPEAPPPPPAPPPPALSSVTARADMAPTDGNQAQGQLTLTATSNGVQITGQISGLEPGGTHGFHVHEVGDCSAPDASSAGPHFDPHGHVHGHPGEGEHHVGDMLNVVADDTGLINAHALAKDATLGDGGATDILGRAIVLHAGADDYSSQPAGDSGPRIACGVIQR